MARTTEPDPPEAPDTISYHAREVAAQFWQWHVGDFSPRECWSPLVNVYRLDDRYRVCVDLAGLRVEDVEIQLMARSMTIRGNRHAPDPRGASSSTPSSSSTLSCTPRAPMRIISMEIDHGPFSRTISLAEPIDRKAVATHYHEGYLWIDLPIARS